MNVSHSLPVLVVAERAGLEAEVIRPLTALGGPVEVVSTRAEAWERLGAPEPPGLLVVDWTGGIPGCGARLSPPSHDAAGSVPCLALVCEGQAARALEAGADDALELKQSGRLLTARAGALLRRQSRYRRMADDLHRLAQVGIALSGEHQLDRLLDRIVRAARELNRAEAATLYTVDPDARLLQFQVMQNELLNGREPPSLPPVPLEPSTVSGYVALTARLVNIPDVYEAEGFDFSGPRRYDSLTGYRSRSMLVVPVRNHEDEVIAVLQLINARDPVTGEVVPFSRYNVDRSRALASQAGVALTNARLIQDLQALMEGLIQAMAAAIDQKSACTSGHVRRVTRLGLLLAEAVNAVSDDRFEGRRFTPEELEELRIAGLLHDLGKIVVPEHVIDKATKLQTVYDRIAEIRTRFSVIRRGLENDALSRKLELLQGGAAGAELANVDEVTAAEIRRLEADLAFLEQLNHGGEAMREESLRRLHAIAARTFRDDRGVERPYLTEDEVRNLSILRGTLLPEELERIRDHVRISSRLLERIPFPRRLRNVPVYAGDHHEALNGTGYPNRKRAEQLPLASRILAVVDIFDALTAADRPYKSAYPVEVAHRILREEAAAGRLDERLVELFIQADCFGRLRGETVGEESAAAPGPAGRGAGE